MTRWEDVIESLTIDRAARGARLDLSDLCELADAEGCSFVSRTAAEWADGTNRFDRPGEGLLIAHLGKNLVGMCGLNIDPFLSDPRVGRLRHLYVHPTQRRRGIAGQLVAACLDLASGSFDRVRLRTFDPAAIEFYLATRFTPVAESSATHTTTIGSR